MLFFFLELRRNGSVWYLDAWYRCQDCISTDGGSSFVETKLSWFKPEEKEPQPGNRAGEDTSVTCESLGTNQSHVPTFLSLLACEPSPGEFSGKMLECKTFHYQIFDLGQTNSGVTLISKARTHSQNTDLWFLVTNMFLFKPNLCKSTCF